MTRPLFSSSALFVAAIAAWTTLAAGCAGNDGRAAGAGHEEEVGSSAEALTRKCSTPSNGPGQGRDVSVYQGNFNWAAAHAGGVVFGYARVSDGLGAIDSTFAGNWASMKANGVLRGAYQFFEPGEDEVAQANMVVQHVGKLGAGDLPATIDVEVTGGQAPATIAAKVRHWLQIVEAGTGKRPIIYTGGYFWQDNVGDTSFGAYPLWIAAYIDCPSIPAGWSDWTIWQYSDGAGTLDHDVFNGGLPALQALANGTAAPSFLSVVRRSATDVNGDGSSDVCARAAAGVVCNLAGAGGFPVTVQTPEFSDAKGWKDDRYGSTVQFADVNGDGKADVCGRGAGGFFCQLSDGTSFPTTTPAIPWSDKEGWDAPPYYATIQLADVDGDGKVDACARGYAGIECYLASGQGFGTKITGPAWSDPSGWSAPQYYTSIQYADVNGDGKTDVCGRAAAGLLCFLSDGQGFPTQVNGPAWSDAAGWADPSTASTVRFLDIDGDGKADVCGRGKDGVHCALSQGNGFGADIVGPAWSDANGWNKPEYYSTLVYGDFDGTGKSVLCGRAAAGVTCSAFDGKAFGAAFAGPAWSDASGWNKPGYYRTLGAADIDHDGKDDLCGRAAKGIVCVPSHGGGFGAEVDGPALSDATGWGDEPYYDSIRYLGDAHAGPGGGQGGGGVGGAGGPGGGAGAGPGGSAAASGQSDDGGGCATSPRGASSGGSAFPALFALVGLGLRRRRARASATPR